MIPGSQVLRAKQRLCLQPVYNAIANAMVTAASCPPQRAGRRKQIQPRKSNSNLQHVHANGQSMLPVFVGCNPSLGCERMDSAYSAECPPLYRLSFCAAMSPSYIYTVTVPPCLLLTAFVSRRRVHYWFARLSSPHFRITHFPV